MDINNLALLNSRIEIAFYALIMMIIVQIMIIGISVLLKKTCPATPLLEILMRPFIITLVDKLNREGRTKFALMMRGAIVFFVVFAILCGAAIAIEQLAMMAWGTLLIEWASFGMVIPLIPWLFILSPITVLYVVHSASVEKPRQGAYLRLAQSLNQNLLPADNHGLRRAGCKAMAVTLIEWVIAPLLFYIVFGMIGAYLYVSLSLLVRIAGAHNNAFLSIFGLLYKIMTVISSLLGTIIIFTSSFFSAGGKPLKVFKAFRYPSLMVEAAFAYAQNITLGGAYQDRVGTHVKSIWVGADGATAKLDHRDVLRVIIQYGITLFLVIILLMALVIY